MTRRLVRLILIALGALAALAPVCAGAASPPAVVLRLAGPIDDETAGAVGRAAATARNEHAAAIVLDVDSRGGLLPAATAIQAELAASGVPVFAFVARRAYGAAALVTVGAERIVMAPGASLGAAEPAPGSPLTRAQVRTLFTSAAGAAHHDVTIAAAMVDPAVDEPGLKPSGSVLTLRASDAARIGFAEALDPALPQALARFGLGAAPVQTASYSLGERAARVLSDPRVSGLLLTIGIVGLLLEMQTLTGIAGIAGIVAFAIFFGAHIVAGFSDGAVVVLALAGVAGILLELHVLPGHGIAGFLGVIALGAAVVLAFGLPFIAISLPAVAIAIVVSIAIFAVVTRFIPTNKFMERLTFVDGQGDDYVTSDDHRALAGRTGYAASFLRPAGVATIDGRRVDVLTEGEFVTAGTPLLVTRVEGARIFVRPA